jgi:hypothetical protein
LGSHERLSIPAEHYLILTNTRQQEAMLSCVAGKERQEFPDNGCLVAPDKTWPSAPMEPAWG